MYYCGNVCNRRTSHCCVGGHNYAFMADVIERKHYYYYVWKPRAVKLNLWTNKKNYQIGKKAVTIDVKSENLLSLFLVPRCLNSFYVRFTSRLSDGTVNIGSWTPITYVSHHVSPMEQWTSETAANPAREVITRYMDVWFYILTTNVPYFIHILMYSEWRYEERTHLHMLNLFSQQLLQIHTFIISMANDVQLRIVSLPFKIIG